MTKTAFVLILISVTITAFAQLVLKAGMNSIIVQRSIANGWSISTVFRIIFDPLVFCGLVIYFFAAMVWLAVLSKVDISLAYPFVALGFVITAIFGHLYFQETLNATRIIGTLFICSGVIILMRG